MALKAAKPKQSSIKHHSVASSGSNDAKRHDIWRPLQPQPLFQHAPWQVASVRFFVWQTDIKRMEKQTCETWKTVGKFQVTKSRTVVKDIRITLKKHAIYALDSLLNLNPNLWGSFFPGLCGSFVVPQRSSIIQKLQLLNLCLPKTQALAQSIHKPHQPQIALHHWL